MMMVDLERLALSLALVRHRDSLAQAEAARLAAAHGKATRLTTGGGGAPAPPPSRPSRSKPLPSLIRWLEARREEGQSGQASKALVFAGIALLDDELGLHDGAACTQQIPGGPASLQGVMERVLAAAESGGVGHATLALTARL